MGKPRLSFWQIWNMSFGFLGIQFGFALQGGFMSRIFQTLGAEPHQIPGLWLAAPITGLVVQPIIGYLSDRTWHPTLGRRRPFFLIGAILASITLVFVPYSPVLWVAAGCLWILDSSINISMEPFRALVADKLPDEQRSNGFLVQTLIIGIGTWIASQLPWFLNRMGVSNEAAMGEIPANVKYAFAIGAVVFIGSILYTIFTTSEYSPEETKQFRDREKANQNNEVKRPRLVPKIMLKLGVIQFFSWFAFFTMWSMATPALTEHVFDAPKPDGHVVSMTSEAYLVADAKYNDAADLVGSAMGSYGLSSMVFAFILTLVTRKRRINRKYVHMVSLILGGLGFLLMYQSHDSTMLNLCFVLIGVAWGSILSMPYAMLSSAIDPDKMGLFMGLFNMFIVIPQIVASLGGINLFSSLFFGEATINTMLLAGSSLVLAGLCNFLITNPKAITYTGD